MDLDPPILLDAHVAPADVGSKAGATVTMDKCNDCTLRAVLACLAADKATGFAAGYELPGPKLSSEPLVPNIVGLRILDSVTNRFDDRMVVFYKPVGLDGDKPVAKADLPLGAVSVDQAQALLATDDAKGDLTLDGELLPGRPSENTTKGEWCRRHRDWKVLVCPITTDPGYVTAKEKKKIEGEYPVPIEDEQRRSLPQGVASLASGHYPTAHRIGLHLSGAPNGFTALVQKGDLDVRCGVTVQYLVGRLNADLATNAEKGADAAYFKAHPGAGDREWLAHLVAHYGKILEVRRWSFSGPRVGSHVAPEFTVSEAPHPSKPGVMKRVLTVTGLSSETEPLEDDAVILLERPGGGINIHHSDELGSESAKKPVYDWSRGCQVYRSLADYRRFRRLCMLSKRAYCKKRRDGSCPSIQEKYEPTVSIEDVIVLQLANEWASYKAARLTSTLAERQAAAENALYAAVVTATAVQHGLDAVAASIRAAAATPPRPVKGAAARRAAVKKVVAEHLFPGPAYGKLHHDLELASSKAAVEAAVAGDPAGDASEKKWLDDLARRLDALTAERKAAAAADVAKERERCEKVRARWIDDGHELCDFTGCPWDVDYTLAEVDKSLVDAVDARYHGK
jgi:hypothetical protein